MAGKLMLRQIQELAQRHVSFGFETTLSGKAYVRLIKDLQSQGYAVHLIYLWLPSVDLAIQRVKDRIRQGGHSVPESDIRRRFKRGLENLMNTYRFIADDWQVYDNQTEEPRMVAFGRPDGVAFKDQEFYASVKHFVEKI